MMGCDIHMYIEYASKEAEKPEHKWQNFGKEFRLNRNYLMFGILCKGVRTEPTFSFEPKGLPEHIAYYTLNDNRLFITEDGEGDGEATLANALQWEKHGHKIILGQDNKPTWVEHPDWHSHSWLTTTELQKAIHFYNTNANPTWTLPEYEAVLASMKRLEELGYDSRIVFWFDN